ncbi:MAG: RsmB/NOP family class I SAM-dependent RNA methyltransferase, partial [Sphingobacteriales bacterium]
MRYILQHIAAIVDQYTGDVPLTHFLKQYFKRYPKLGSRDRKILSEMSYCWYRCSKALPSDMEFERRMQACLFLSNTENNHAHNFLPEAWKENKQLPLHEKIALLLKENIVVTIEDIIAYNDSFSDGISKQDWIESLLQQPALFIRVRKDEQKIETILANENIPFTKRNETCCSLPNGAAIDKLLPAKAYVVQDASSQQTGEYFHAAPGEQWWDCCSGAGGKSLLLMDKEPTIKLTVSDKRKTILHNLQERFALYGHKPKQASVLDMSDEAEIQKAMKGKLFDNIICDVPCTGSGTWARTPEQAYYFDEEGLFILSALQHTIAINASAYLKKGGTLHYITCSVFKTENEAVVE